MSLRPRSRSRPTVPTTQTTLSVDDTRDIIATLARALPGDRGAEERRHLLCHPESPGRKVRDLVAEGRDAALVVGSPNSSNSNRLRELAEREGACRRG